MESSHSYEHISCLSGRERITRLSGKGRRRDGAVGGSNVQLLYVKEEEERPFGRRAAPATLVCGSSYRSPCSDARRHRRLKEVLQGPLLDWPNRKASVFYKADFFKVLTFFKSVFLFEQFLILNNFRFWTFFEIWTILHIWTFFESEQILSLNNFWIWTTFEYEQFLDMKNFSIGTFFEFEYFLNQNKFHI